jgi:glycopeptide antibiotics resistance protein
MRLILQFFEDMVPYLLPALPAVLLFRLFSAPLAARHGYRTTVQHEIGLAVFLLFLAGLFSQTIVPESGIRDAGPPQINLVPFQVFQIIYRDYLYNHSIDYFLVSFIGNIAMFVPLGFFIPLLFKASLRRTAFAGFVLSLFIEICQLPLSRWTDIDDLWLNTLGALLGFGLYKAVLRGFPQQAKRFKMQKEQVKSSKTAQDV